MYDRHMRKKKNETQAEAQEQVQVEIRAKGQVQVTEQAGTARAQALTLMMQWRQQRKEAGSLLWELRRRKQGVPKWAVGQISYEYAFVQKCIKAVEWNESMNLCFEQQWQCLLKGYG